jgi:surfeit locus 1 family protein
MRLGGLGIATTIAFLILAGLGTWQLQRRTEKLAFIEHYEAGLKAPAQPLPARPLWSSKPFSSFTDFSRFENTKVRIEGRFLPLREVHLYALLAQREQRYGGIGWWVIMPFEMKNGDIVFVNRGFVPQDLKNPSARQKSLTLPANQVLEGLVRLPEKPGIFTPASNASANEWYLRDPEAFAAYEHIDKSRIAPLVIDQLTPNPEGLPQVSNGKLHIANNHLQYALTWYALALVLLVMYFLLRRSRKASHGTSQQA